VPKRRSRTADRAADADRRGSRDARTGWPLVASALLLFGITTGATFVTPLTCAAAEGVDLRFDFGSGKLAPGYTPVLASDLYGNGGGYGFDLGSVVSCPDRGGEDPLRSDLCTSEAPFFFSVAVPEGDYREKGALHWDDKLTLEFAGDHPSVVALEISKLEDALTVFLAGDSTVTDQTREPWASWGQMLPRFFGPDVAVANHAESGETLLAFRSEGRLAKVLSQIKAGDYLFIQFAHNDQKPGPNHLEAFTTYKEQLQSYVQEARRRAATPVLMTSMPRRRATSC
jgi:hypothetical protein